MATFYTVRPGDTLSSIAREFGTTVQNLVAWNQITDVNLIFAGQTLIVSQEGDDSGGGAGSVSSRVIDGLLYTLSTDQRTYRRGEPVNIKLTKRNTTSTTRRLTYNTGQRFEFEAVRSDGVVVWRWSAGRVFTQQTATVTLRPGESQEFDVTWDQRNLQGNLVAAQTLTIRGYNWAQGLRNRFVSTRITITSAGTTTPPTTRPPDSVCRPGVNLLENSGFEVWPNPTALPPDWQGSNIIRQDLIRHSGRYGARMGDNPRRQARLSQTVAGSPGRVYRLAFWIREVPQVPPGSNFRFRTRIFFYNAAGRLIGTADPEYSEDFVPENFVQYSMTSGLTPPATRTMEVRFDFVPEAGNNNPVVLDDIFLECLR